MGEGRESPAGARPSETLRLLVRHQWVRDHGTPRVTTLVGPPGSGRASWDEWLELSGRAPDAQPLIEQPPRVGPSWLDGAASDAARRAEAAPRRPVAIAASRALVDRWLGSRGDRLGALVAEGLVPVGRARTLLPRAPSSGRAAPGARARSLAELTLFEALEATPSLAGRFLLNQSVSFQFGSRAAEIDLLSRQDEIALEVDGFHHFTDADHYRRDRRKDALLQAHGYAVLRFLAEDVLADPRAAIRMVSELVARRPARERLRRKP